MARARNRKAAPAKERVKLGRPPENRADGENQRLARWFDNIRDTIPVTNEALAKQFEGLTRPNILSMWRTGSTKIALKHLTTLAKVTNTPLSKLLSLWLLDEAGEQDSDELEAVARRLGAMT